MCVVALAVDQDNRLTPAMIEAMYEANSSGAGAAWREVRQTAGQPAKTVVRWSKGLDLQEIQKLLAEIPIPHVAHFRIPTVGGSTKALCHPFPIKPDAPTNYEGETTGYVLAHNGHWHNWEDKITEIAARGNYKLPAGQWSDTRAMAWAAAHMGLGYLDLKVKEMAVVFGPREWWLVGDPKRWTLTTEKIYVSNLGWRRVEYSTGRNKNWRETSGPTADSMEDHSRGINRMPTDGGQTSDTRLPVHYQGPTSGLVINRPEVTVPHGPFDRKGRLIVEITPDMMARWELAHRQMDPRNHQPLLSKKKLKKYRRAYEIQQRERGFRETQARIARAQEDLEKMTHSTRQH